ncbi:MAG: ABC transporter permease [Clostridiales bacterium]|jgi:ribose transport system permease protein|nr:ABC transporter permease [Clostridiales bacterium]
MTRGVKAYMGDLVPLFTLLALTLFFSAATKGALLSAMNLNNILNQSIPPIIAGLGMMFVVAMGATDISTGVVVALASYFACMAVTAAGFWAAFPAAILAGLCTGLLIGVINTRFKVPSFMITLSFVISVRALVTLMLGIQTLQIAKPLRDLFNGWAVRLSVLAGLVLIVVYVFNYTPLGMYAKAIGENENAVKYTGINVSKVKIAAFAISGVMAAIAGVFTAARVGGVSTTLGTSFEMKVMMGLFIGGIPVSGGMGTKVSKLIAGCLMITLLESGLVLLNVSGAITQGVRGLVLLAAVYFARVVSLSIHNRAEAR